MEWLARLLHGQTLRIDEGKQDLENPILVNGADARTGDGGHLVRRVRHRVRLARPSQHLDVIIAVADRDGMCPLHSEFLTHELEITRVSQTLRRNERAPVGVSAVTAAQGVFVLGAGLGVPFAISARNSYDDADSVSEQIRGATVEDGLPTTAGVCVNYPTIPGKPERQAQYQAACSKYESKVDDGEKYERYAIISFVVSGAALAGTITYYVLDGVVFADSASREPSKRIGTRPLLVPTAGPGQAGLTLIGQF